MKKSSFFNNDILFDDDKRELDLHRASEGIKLFSKCFVTISLKKE